MTTVYLDHNSTTPIDPLVAAEISRRLAEGWLNPSSQHQLGQKARRELESRRHSIIRILGGTCEPAAADRLVITSGGTESNNLALIGLATHGYQHGRVIVSTIEHPSVVGASDYLSSIGFDVVDLPVNQHGVCKIELLSDLINDQTRVVSMMMANHETGVIQPVEEAARICRDCGVPLHTDATQAIGKIPISFSNLGISAMTVSPHKFYGPRGVGGLLVRHDTELRPIMHGGTQQFATRPGTEDVALVCGFEKALEIAIERLDEANRIKQLRDRFEKKLTDQCQVSVVIHGGEVARLPNTANVGFPDLDRQALLMAADLAGISVSTGSACTSGSSEPSPVLMAMAVIDDIINGSIRISLGRMNTESDIDYAVEKLVAIADNLSRAKST